jgi:hypothetical protein
VYLCKGESVLIWRLADGKSNIRQKRKFLNRFNLNDGCKLQYWAELIPLGKCTMGPWSLQDGFVNGMSELTDRGRVRVIICFEKNVVGDRTDIRWSIPRLNLVDFLGDREMLMGIFDLTGLFR